MLGARVRRVRGVARRRPCCRRRVADLSPGRRQGVRAGDGASSERQALLRSTSLSALAAHGRPGCRVPPSRTLGRLQSRSRRVIPVPRRRRRPPETIIAAEQLLALRGELTAEIAEQGVHEDTALCSARLLARDPVLVNALLAAGDSLTPESQQQLAGAFAGKRDARVPPIRPPACTPETPADRSTTRNALFREMTLWGTAKC